MSIGLSPTAIRFGLHDLQPFEETFEQRIGNIRYVIKQLSLRPAESFRDYSTLSAYAAIENLRDIPQIFPKEKLREFLTQYFRTGIENDPELAKLVKQVESGDTLRGRSSLVTLLSKFVKRYEEQLDNTIRMEMTRFLRSDLPFSLFDQFSLFDRTYAKFLPTVTEAARRMHTRVGLFHRSRGIRGSSLPLEDFKRKISPLLVSCDLAWVSYFSMNLYLDLKNSDDLKSLFQPKTLEAKHLDSHEYDRLFKELSVHNDRFRESLAEYGIRGVESRLPKLNPSVYNVWQETNDFLTAQV